MSNRDARVKILDKSNTTLENNNKSVYHFENSLKSSIAKNEES